MSCGALTGCKGTTSGEASDPLWSIVTQISQVPLPLRGGVRGEAVPIDGIDLCESIGSFWVFGETPILATTS